MYNFWHSEMYDDYFADSTLNSEEAKKRAEAVISFILSKIELPLNANVLDVPCGTGRHSINLANRGLKVTALDISSHRLAIAKKQNAHEKIDYVQGDMKDLSDYENDANLVTNLFSSFGYFHSDEENFQILKNFLETV